MKKKFRKVLIDVTFAVVATLIVAAIFFAIAIKFLAYYKIAMS